MTAENALQRVNGAGWGVAVVGEGPQRGLVQLYHNPCKTDLDGPFTAPELRCPKCQDAAAVPVTDLLGATAIALAKTSKNQTMPPRFMLTNLEIYSTASGDLDHVYCKGHESPQSMILQFGPQLSYRCPKCGLAVEAQACHEMAWYEHTRGLQNVAEAATLQSRTPAERIAALRSLHLGQELPWLLEEVERMQAELARRQWVPVPTRQPAIKTVVLWLSPAGRHYEGYHEGGYIWQGRPGDTPAIRVCRLGEGLYWQELPPAP